MQRWLLFVCVGSVIGFESPLIPQSIILVSRGIVKFWCAPDGLGQELFGPRPFMVRWWKEDDMTAMNYFHHQHTILDLDLEFPDFRNSIRLVCEVKTEILVFRKVWDLRVLGAHRQMIVNKGEAVRLECPLQKNGKLNLWTAWPNAETWKMGSSNFPVDYTEYYIPFQEDELDRNCRSGVCKIMTWGKNEYFTITKALHGDSGFYFCYHDMFGTWLEYSNRKQSWDDDEITYQVRVLHTEDLMNWTNSRINIELGSDVYFSCKTPEGEWECVGTCPTNNMTSPAIHGSLISFKNMSVEQTGNYSCSSHENYEVTIRNVSVTYKITGAEHEIHKLRWENKCVRCTMKEDDDPRETETRCDQTLLYASGHITCFEEENYARFSIEIEISSEFSRHASLLKYPLGLTDLIKHVDREVMRSVIQVPFGSPVCVKCPVTRKTDTVWWNVLELYETNPSLKVIENKTTDCAGLFLEGMSPAQIGTYQCFNLNNGHLKIGRVGLRGFPEPQVTSQLIGSIYTIPCSKLEIFFSPDFHDSHEKIISESTRLSSDDVRITRFYSHTSISRITFEDMGYYYCVNDKLHDGTIVWVGQLVSPREPEAEDYTDFNYMIVLGIFGGVVIVLEILSLVFFPKTILSNAILNIYHAFSGNYSLFK